MEPFALVNETAPASGIEQLSSTQAAEYEDRFQLALSLMATSPDLAAYFLEALYAETGSPRVGLELARALFIAKRYKQSEKVFRAVLEAGVPSEAEAKARLFLAEIGARSRGPYSASASLLFDANPANGIEPQSVEIFGLDFNFEDESYRSASVGLGLSGRYDQSFDAQFLDRLVVEPRLRFFPGIDYATMDLSGETTSSISKRGKLHFGTTLSADSDSLQVSTNYLRATHTFSDSSNVAVQISYQAGLTEGLTDRYAGVKGHFWRVQYAQALNTSSGLLSGTAFYSDVLRDDEFSSFSEYGTSLSLTFNATPDLQVRPRGSLSQKDFYSVDPFFGNERRDTSFFLGLDSTWLGAGITMRPALSVGFEGRISNQSLYEFKGLRASLSIGY